MKIQRIALLVLLTMFFCGCYYVMNLTFDPLARYPYATNENRDIILSVINNEEIQYIIDEDIKPQEFLPFAKITGFDMTKTKAYYQASLVCDDDFSDIVQGINSIGDAIPLETLTTYLKNYQLADLVIFAQQKDIYNPQSTLILDPSAVDVCLSNDRTVYRYEPKDLQEVTAMKVMVSNSVQLRKETNEALGNLCKLAQDDLHQECGGLIGVYGYLSYDEQKELYDDALLKYGPDEVEKHFLYPGHNDYQLGNTIYVITAQANETSFYHSQQYQWLLDNAYKFGFIIRYPLDKQSSTNMIGQPYQIRYVGITLATELHEKNLSLEEWSEQK